MVPRQPKVGHKEMAWYHLDDTRRQDAKGKKANLVGHTALGGTDRKYLGQLKSQHGKRSSGRVTKAQKV